MLFNIARKLSTVAQGDARLSGKLERVIQYRIKARTLQIINMDNTTTLQEQLLHTVSAVAVVNLSELLLHLLICKYLMLLSVFWQMEKLSPCHLSNVISSSIDTQLVIGLVFVHSHQVKAPVLQFPNVV